MYDFDDNEENDGIEHWSFHFDARYGDSQTSVTRRGKGQTLTEILNDFVLFLKAAGYGYVERLEAHSPNNTHSSDIW